MREDKRFPIWKGKGVGGGGRGGHSKQRGTATRRTGSGVHLPAAL